MGNWKEVRLERELFVVIIREFVEEIEVIFGDIIVRIVDFVVKGSVVVIVVVVVDDFDF